MARKKAKPKRLRLRDISGLLEDVEVSLPVSWAASLRVRAEKLGLSLNAFLAQYVGHLAAEVEKLEEAVETPTVSDDVARFRLRGAFLKTFEAEALRSGLPVSALVHNVISDAADSFAGRVKAPLPKPLILIPGHNKLGSR